MKKLIYLAVLLTGITATAATTPNDISEKVLKAFNETFTGAEDVTWHEYDDYAQANFHQDNIQVRAQYDENGNLIKTIRYYTERELMPNIVAKLKKRYAGREIAGVTETTTDQEITFIINLKDKEHWYIVKSDAYGNLQQTDKYKRADN